MAGLTKTILSHLWQEFCTRFQRRVLKKSPLKPWMRPREVEIIQELLERAQPQRVLEWGAGYGTIFFAEGSASLEHWVSLEHDGVWAREIGALNKDSRVEIVHVKANDPVLTDRFRDGTYHNFKDYIEYPERLKPFDLVLVDGRARTDCMERARNYLKEDGILILHDANRSWYRTYPRHYADHCLFQDHRTEEGGLWIASLKRPVKDLVDYPRHRKVWRFFEKLGNLLGGDL